VLGTFRGEPLVSKARQAPALSAVGFCQAVGQETLRSIASTRRAPTLETLATDPRPTPLITINVSADYLIIKLARGALERQLRDEQTTPPRHQPRHLHPIAPQVLAKSCVGSGVIDSIGDVSPLVPLHSGYDGLNPASK
jgi:hypothetical protein